MISIVALLALPFAVGLRARAFTWQWRLLILVAIGAVIVHSTL